jgi:hypothetical protein
VEDELVEAAAALQAGSMEPAPATPDSAGGLRKRPGFDLPSETVRLPQWQAWVRRLRDAVVNWQLAEEQREKQQKREQQAQMERQQAQQGQQQAQEPPAVAATAAAPSASAAAAASSSRSLSGSFLARCRTPDGLHMEQELLVTVAPPGGLQLLRRVSRGFAWSRLRCGACCCRLGWRC